MSGGYPPELDHLVVACPDLDATVADLASRMGVHFRAGGRHPAWGTRNAILPLGPGVYLEMIGPDPTPGAPVPAIFGIANLAAPRLATWAAKGSRLAQLSARAVSHGIDLGAPGKGERLRPDGTALRWELTDPFTPREGGVLPFFIEWEGSNHPSEAAAARASLLRLTARHPEPERVRRQLAVLGMALEVEPAPVPGLIALLQTPKGRVTLEG